MILPIAEEIDALLSALSDPVRRRAVELLGGGPRRAGELAEGVGMPATTISRHLKQLRDSGIVDVVTVEDDARGRVYSLRADRMIALQAWIDQVSAGWSEQLGRFQDHAERKGRPVASDVASASVEVAIDQKAAFRMFTEEVGDWYLIDRHTVVDHTRTKTLRFDPWVGGRFRAIYDLETGEGDQGALITAWEPPRRLVFVDSRDMEVEVVFEPIDGGCRVTIEQRGFDKLEPDVAGQVREHGWFVHLPEWFGEYVTGHRSPA